MCDECPLLKTIVTEDKLLNLSWKDRSCGYIFILQMLCIRSVQPAACGPHAAQHSCTAATFCLMPSWWQLCPAEEPGPGRTTTKQLWAISTLWAGTKGRGGCRAVLTAVMANNCMHFDTLAKHSALNNEEYAAVLFIFIKEFEKRFQDCKKK